MVFWWIMPIMQSIYVEFFFSISHNEEDYVHPAHCGVQSCRKAIQLMRAKHFLNAVQRAGEHRRVLGAGFSFLFFSKQFKNNNMNLYNLEKLVKIVVNDFYISRWYYYQKRKTFLGLTTKEEGVYNHIWNDFQGVEIPKNLALKDGILHEKPEVTLYYESNIEKSYFFDTLKEATDFRDKVKELSGAKFLS